MFLCFVIFVDVLPEFYIFISLLFRFVVFDMAGLTGLKPNLICFTSDNTPTKKCVKDGAKHTLTSVFLVECKVSVSLISFFYKGGRNHLYSVFLMYIFGEEVVLMFWKLYILGLLKMPLFILSTLTVKSVLLWKE